MSSLALTIGKRNIKDGSRFNGLFPTERNAYNNYAILKKDGNVAQTVKFIADIIKKDKADTFKISQQLKAPTRFQTLKNIHSFIVNYLQYDTEEGEKLRSPRRTWWVGSQQNDKQTGDKGVDCDDLSIFAGTILLNLNIPFFIRIVKINKDVFQHVYLIVPKVGDTLNKSYYTLDGVISEFNYEHQFKQQKTFDMNGLPIEYLGALGNVVQNDSEQLHDILQQYYNGIVEGEIVPTKINAANLIKRLGYALQYWYTANHLQSLKILADQEMQNTPGQTFFAKVYEQELNKPGLNGYSIPGLDIPTLRPLPASNTSQPTTTSSKSSSGSKGSGVANVLSSLFNAAANFDWGLVGGKKRTNQQPVTPPATVSTTTGSGINMGTMMSGISGYLIGGALVYGAYKLFIEKKPIVPVGSYKNKNLK